jgi:hypothetical protein
VRVGDARHPSSRPRVAGSERPVPGRVAGTNCDVVTRATSEEFVHAAVDDCGDLGDVDVLRTVAKNPH